MPAKRNVQLPALDNVGELETFPPEAFWDDNPKTQKVCDFVLSLALIFNDFKDLLWAGAILGQAAPKFEENFHETPQWGHFTGLDHHIHRLKIGLIEELRRLLETQTKVTESELFAGILRDLQKLDRTIWIDLTNPDSDLRRLLGNIRNTISYHYFFTAQDGRKVIGDGYRAVFRDPQRRPYLSRGDRPLDTRFYFADAAALEMDKLIRAEDWQEQLEAHASRIVNALYSIVLLFLRARGYLLKKA